MKIGSHFILFPFSQNLNPVLIPRGEGSTGPWTSRSREDRGYISRLGKRDGGSGSSSRLGERDRNEEGGDRNYLGLEEKIPWIRLRKRGGTGGDAVPWVRLKKAGREPSVLVDSAEEVEQVWFV